MHVKVKPIKTTKNELWYHKHCVYNVLTVLVYLWLFYKHCYIKLNQTVWAPLITDPPTTSSNMLSKEMLI